MKDLLTFFGMWAVVVGIWIGFIGFLLTFTDDKFLPVLGGWIALYAMPLAWVGLVMAWVGTR